MKVILKLTNMHCTSCAILIDTVLEELPGVKSSKTSYADNQVEVEFDPTLVNVNQILQVIENEGYTASL